MFNEYSEISEERKAQFTNQANRDETLEQQKHTWTEQEVV